jgi:hypothetical protein
VQGFLLMLLRVLIDCCRSRQDLALENLALRHQLEVLLRRKPKAASAQPGPDPFALGAAALAGEMDKSTEDRATGDSDRLASQKLAPVLDLEIAHAAWPAAPEPRSPGTDCSNVERQPSAGHRAHRGELLKLMIVVSNRSIRHYRWCAPKRERSQRWRTFLRNQIKGIWAAASLSCKPVGFHTLYVFFFIRHERRELIDFSLAASPTAAWIWRQVIEATA